MAERTKAWVRDRILQGEALGHTMGVSHREPPEDAVDPGARTKYWGTCSCGWKSNARFSQKVAVGAAFAHLGKVTAEAEEAPAEARRNGVSLQGSAAPSL